MAPERAWRLAGAETLVFVIAGAALLVRICNPFIRRLEESEARVRAIVSSAGDGIITGLAVLQVMAATGENLADLASGLVLYPQVLKNVRVKQKRELSAVPPVANAMARVEERLAGRDHECRS